MRREPDMNLGRVMTQSPYSVGDDLSVAEVHQRMIELGVGHLPVLRGSRLVGVVDRRDLVTLVATTGRHPSELPVTAAIARRPYVASTEAPMSEVIRTMLRDRHGAVVAVDRGEVRGIFTRTDGLALLAELTHQVQP